MNKNILGTISICKKASKLIAGADVVFAALEENKARLIVVSSDCSPKTIKPIVSLAQIRGVAVMTAPCTKEELGISCGKSVCAVVAITDIGLASSLGKKLATSSEKNEQVSQVLDLKLKRKIEREERKADPTQARVKKPKVEYHKDKDLRTENKEQKHKFDDKKPRYDEIRKKARNDSKKTYKKHDDENSSLKYNDAPPTNGVKWSKFNNK
ncbi:MAG: ribosomal L7Ae/L30e/S12e/Gadd45 family protein [Clostridia bacterium]